MSGSRLPILYLAPWVDFGGSDKGTIDWFRTLDRSRFTASLITTQPSGNPRLAEVVPFAQEVWALPDLMAGERFAEFILDFIVSREVGLVHVMNSRLGFDLLPDISVLEHAPKVVVQLHVEEPGRAGYVRYVTTRYGNLVDAFSVSSAHLADAVWGYGIPRGRIAVVPTGVDCESEFSPSRVEPWPGLREGPVRILYPGRLVEQKDPLLMVEVARELSRRGLDFAIHVVGAGDLELAVREQVEAHGLAGCVLFEAPTRELARWYRAADLVLMTSRFEGVPYVIYEALAMGVPVVAPKLPGNVELMGGVGGTLIEERERAAAYADALEPLIGGRELRERVGAQGRERMLAGFSLQAMAERHAELYLRIGAQRSATADRGPIEGLAEPVAFAPRATGAVQPLVSIVTPCFDDGRRLRDCLASVRAQSYREIEVIVVDDGSSDHETTEFLAELDREGTVTLVRLGRNGGPGAARNRGIERARGRYILPLDADNLLLPDAVATLVEQLEAADADVGFVYQNLQFFGTREDYMEVPSYNPWLLTRANFVDACALLDRGIFERGLRYPEDMPHGHEDWDFAVTLAEHGVRGEPAGAKTLLYGKHGFSRSDTVEWVAGDFHADLAKRHPAMFATATQSRGDNPQVRLKARWAPALSVIALAQSIEQREWEQILRGLRDQRLRDFEFYASRADASSDVNASLPPLRAHPPAAGGRGGALAAALAHARGRNVLVSAGSAGEFLADPGGLERVVRLLEAVPTAHAELFADAGPGLYPFAPLSGSDPALAPHAVAFSRRHEELRDGPTQLDERDPVGVLGRWLLGQRIELGWRQMTAPRSAELGGDGPVRRARAQAPPRSHAQTLELEACLAAAPCLPGRVEPLRRWATLRTWMAAGTAPLVRHRRGVSEEWIVNTSFEPPRGYHAEHYLGAIHRALALGTVRIVAANGSYDALAPGGDPDAAEMARTLGYADAAALPMLEPLLLCRLRSSGAHVLVCGADDPIAGLIEEPHERVLGWIDRIPVNPRSLPAPAQTHVWLRGLVRTLDRRSRRHRVALAVAGGAGGAEAGVWELGALLDRDPGGGIPAWIDAGGRLFTRDYAPTRHPFDLRRSLEWVAAPASWHDFGRPLARARAIARRSVDAAHYTLERPGIARRPEREPRAQAWLLAQEGRGRVPIFSAVHPVTADQLVTSEASEADELGYAPAQLIGYALALAPVTGSLSRPDVAVAWATRFGESAGGGDRPQAAIRPLP